MLILLVDYACGSHLKKPQARVFGAEGTLNNGVYERASMSGKFRIGSVRNEYFKGGNYDIIGLYEGII